MEYSYILFVKDDKKLSDCEFEWDIEYWWKYRISCLSINHNLQNITLYHSNILPSQYPELMRKRQEQSTQNMSTQARTRFRASK